MYFLFGYLFKLCFLNFEFSEINIDFMYFDN